MAPRIALQVFLFVLPFILFGLYRLAVAEAQEEGRKPWPLHVLFGIGAAVSIGAWLVLIVMDSGKAEECYAKKQIVDGKIVGGESYPCEKDLETAGIPLTEDPGGVAVGVVGEGTDDTPQPLEIDEETSERLRTPPE